MSEEKFWVEGSMSKEDMGETISLMMEKLGIDADRVADDIETKAMIINSAMKGKGNHVYNVLSKMCNKYKMKTTMIIEEE